MPEVGASEKKPPACGDVVPRLQCSKSEGYILPLNDADLLLEDEQVRRTA